MTNLGCNGSESRIWRRAGLGWTDRQPSPQNSHAPAYLISGPDSSLIQATRTLLRPAESYIINLTCHSQRRWPCSVSPGIPSNGAPPLKCDHRRWIRFGDEGKKRRGDKETRRQGGGVCISLNAIWSCALNASCLGQLLHLWQKAYCWKRRSFKKIILYYFTLWHTC